jgi:hypothetical protein
MLGGWRASGGRSGAAQARALGDRLPLPAIAGLACVVMTAGTLRLHEVVEAQGAAPWSYCVQNRCCSSRSCW